MLNMGYEHASIRIDGAKLRRMRKEAGLNVSQLAKLVDVSIGFLSAVERGARPTVAPGRYITICDALGIEDRKTLYAEDQAKVVAA